MFARHGLSFVRDPYFDVKVASRDSRNAGQVERVVVEPPAPDKGPACVRLSGWAADPTTGEPAREVLLVHGTTVLKRSAVRGLTQDPVSGHNGTAQSASKWTMYVSRLRWPEDPSALKLLAVGSNGDTAFTLGNASSVRLPAGDLSRYEALYKLGTDIFPGESTDGCVLDGFSGAEPGGRWTDGTEAQLSFTLSSAATTALTLSLTADAFVTPARPKQTVEVIVNDQAIARWEFLLNERSRERTLRIPASVVAGQRRVLITLRLPDAESPAHLNLSADRRLLGLRIVRFRLAAAP